MGNALTFKLITKDTKQEIECRVVIPARHVYGKTITWDPALDAAPDNDVSLSANPQRLNPAIALAQCL